LAKKLTKIILTKVVMHTTMTRATFTKYFSHQCHIYRLRPANFQIRQWWRYSMVMQLLFYLLILRWKD